MGLMSVISVVSPTEFTVSGPYGPLYACHWAGDADKTPILLLHDSIGAVSLWRDFPEKLAAATGRQVIAYDRAGFGRSVVRTQRVSKDFILAEAHEGIVPVLDARGIEKAILFGHSVGGGMALSAAAVLGERVSGVISVAAQSFVEDRTLAGVREARVAFAKDGQVERLARYHGERATWVLSAWIDTWLAATYADWSLEPLLPLIKVPVLAMHGENDEYGSLEHPGMIARLSGGHSAMKVFESVGHMPHKEATEAVLAETAGFIETL